MDSDSDFDEIVEGAWDALDDGALEEAAELAREARRMDEADPDPHAILGAVAFESLDLGAARAHLAEALDRDAAHPDAHFWMALVCEREGQETKAARHFRDAAKGDPGRYPLAHRLSGEEFRAEVERAIEALPADFREHLDNLAIVVEPLPDDRILEGDPPLPPTILGLHLGTPRPLHGSASGIGPNTIFLFQKNLERAAKDRTELREQIEVTLLHEIGHYLGLDEDDVEDRGLE